MKYKDYYAALGVPRDADTDQIKKAYRKLAREFHPDVSKAPDAEARFKDAAEAYATLKDPEKRAAYDQLGRRPAGEDFAPPPDWSHAHHGGASGEGSFEGIDLTDLLASLGRMQEGSHRTRPMNGQDHDIAMPLSMEDAHRGRTVTLELADGGQTRTLEVTLPPGLSDGQKLRLRGKGGAGRHGGHDGDIYLHISLAPHPLFRADRHDLYFDLLLAPWEAALGAEVEVPTLDGPVLLTVPPGTRAGRKLRLRGRGLAKGQADRGDLYAAATIDIPASLTEQERSLFQALAQASSFAPRATTTKENADASKPI